MKVSLAFSASVLLFLVSCGSSVTNSVDSGGFNVLGSSRPRMNAFVADRQVYLVTSGTSPTVYYAGKELFNNKCIPSKSNVKSMSFIPPQNVSTTVKGQLSSNAGINLNAQVGRVGGGLSSGYSNVASAVSKVSYSTPGIFSNGSGYWVRELHYNVVVTGSDGKRYSTGWLPDAGGGCTYKVL